LNSVDYIGGNFASTDNDVFFSKVDFKYFDTIFPPKKNELQVNFFETGADALASIIKEISFTCNEIKLWFPDNYCLDTINRILFKLHIKTFNKYYLIEEISEDRLITNVIIALHFNRFDKMLMESIRKKKTNKFLIIEDFVHSPFEISNFGGDYAFNSLRKISNLEIAIAYKNTHTDLTNDETNYYTLKKRAATLKTDFFNNGNKEIEKQYLDLFLKAEESLKNGFINPCLSKEFNKVNFFDFIKIKLIRKKNYDHLKSLLENNKNIEILPGDYMFLMLKTSRRDDLKKHLATHRIFSPIHWADSGSQMSYSILSIPIDQRYTEQDMNRVADIILKFAS